jgi:hypothetical protein
MTMAPNGWEWQDLLDTRMWRGSWGAFGSGFLLNYVRGCYGVALCWVRPQYRGLTAGKMRQTCRRAGVPSQLPYGTLNSVPPRWIPRARPSRFFHSKFSGELGKSHVQVFTTAGPLPPLRGTLSREGRGTETGIRCTSPVAKQWERRGPQASAQWEERAL